MISELQEDEVQKFVQVAANHVIPGGTVVIGGEGEPRSILFARIMNQIRRISYLIVGKLTGLGYHPYHKVAKAMKDTGLILKYKVQFMGGLLVLYVAEAS
jgi:hypothetical protein